MVTSLLLIIMIAKLHFMGTGAAMVNDHYHTSFIIGVGRERILVDAMGGYDIKQALQKNNKTIFDINALFISHGHLDHSLGFLWLVRLLWHQIAHQKPMPKDYVLSVLCSSQLKMNLVKATRALCPEQYNVAKPYLHFLDLREGENIKLQEVMLTPLDLRSKKEEQFGFLLHSGKLKIGFSGDEPLRDFHHGLLKGVDVLIHDSFSLEADEVKFGSRQKHHSTAFDAAKNAAKIKAKTLVLTHIADENPRRKERFTHEAASVFQGKVYVPDDGEIIIL